MSSAIEMLRCMTWIVDRLRRCDFETLYFGLFFDLRLIYDSMLFILVSCRKPVGDTLVILLLFSAAIWISTLPMSWTLVSSNMM